MATFAIVQDRVTAAGARRYAATARQAIADGNKSVTIEEVMAPAVRSSVRWGVASAGLVLLVGLGIASTRA
jgi:ABC-type spermidine/putrescine transport system permease subunit I